MTLTEFLLARVAEDEDLAARATPHEWTGYPRHRKEDNELVGEVNSDSGHYVGGDEMYGPDAEHIARHDPARVLRECEAKRRIVDTLAVPVKVLIHLAESYADHPDYREEWRA